MAANTASSVDAPEMEFGIASNVKRIAYLFVWGVALVVLVSRLVTLWLEQRSPAGDDLFAISSFFLGTVGFTWWLNWIRTRIDAVGVHRRLAWRWTTWTWDDFAIGTVCRGKERTSFVFTSLPFRRRYLSFMFADPAAQDLAMQECLRHWLAPPLPEVPDAISLKIGAPLTRLFRRHDFQADHQGIVITTRAGSKAYSWKEVRRGVVFRTSHEHQDFREMLLELPDRIEKLEVEPEHNFQQWSGPPAATVAAFLERHLSTERFVNCALFGEARCIAEIDARIARYERIWRESESVGKWVFGFGALLLVALFAKYLPDKDADVYSVATSYVAILLMLSFLGGLFWIVRRWVPREQQKMIAELERQRERFR